MPPAPNRQAMRDLERQWDCGELSPQILVVDDQEAIREAFALLLRGGGYRVSVASNGQEALDQLHNAERPDLILLDLMMPVMDGWQFLNLQRRDTRLADIPVIVCSSTWEVLNNTNGLEAAAYLPKPVESEELLRVVRRHCSVGG